MQVMPMRLMVKIEYLIVPKGTKFTGSGKLGLSINAESVVRDTYLSVHLDICKSLSSDS